MRELSQPVALTMEVLVTMNDVFYDEDYDNFQEQEDQWITDILGSEDQIIGDLINE